LEFFLWACGYGSAGLELLARIFCAWLSAMQLLNIMLIHVYGELSVMHMLEGKMSTKGRFEYQFKIYGGITTVFIEVKLNVGGLAERLNCYAQVIAECDGEFRMPLVKTLS
jgi:hypothetical protein